VEPISTIAAVTTVFTGVKKMISAGKEIHDMASDLGKVFDAIDGARSAHRSEAGRKGQALSANQEALTTFIDKKKADDMEEELKSVIIHTRGFSAWGELVQLRATIRRERKEAQEEALKERKEKVEQTIIIGSVAFILACLISLVGLIILGQMGRL
jgi:hypothetical protein